jgi:hypothetical protein
MVYLLGRIGKTREALALIMDQLGDIEQGVEFCKEHDDPELWQELISSTVHRPEFVSYLLQKIGSYVDPQMLIERIQNGCVIEGLKNSLVKLLCDYRLQVKKHPIFYWCGYNFDYLIFRCRFRRVVRKFSFPTTLVCTRSKWRFR